MQNYKIISGLQNIEFTKGAIGYGQSSIQTVVLRIVVIASLRNNPDAPQASGLLRSSQ